MAEYVNTTNHAQQVGSGAFVPAYGTGELNPKATAEDPDDEAAVAAAEAAAAHDAALIADGAFIEADKPKRTRKAEGEEN